MKRIAILASGSGTNAENIISYFEKNKNIFVALILTNNPNAFVLKRAKKLNVRSEIVKNANLNKKSVLLDLLKQYDIDFIVLAGFLKLIPSEIISAYQYKILNIHPALLPKFGGKGMYGNSVHKAVIESGEKESGITIHFVNQFYDEGQIISQHKCPVHSDDTVESLAARIHKLEYKYFPGVIENIVLQG